MKLIEFARLVRAMRAVQREYLRTRQADLFIQSEELEAKVDKAAAEVLDRQTSLFGDSA